MDRKNYFKSKITVPQVLHKLLPRSGVSDILGEASLHEAVCFVAPYGYGKTLAAVSWLRESRSDAVWLTLDASDDSEPVFWAGLSAAMLRYAGWQGDVNDVLSDPAYIAEPQEFFLRAVSAAEERGGEVLVLDDFHHLLDRALLRAVKNVVFGLLGRWRLIIMSRTELPAVFTELILKGHVRLVTPRELSFSCEEMTQFFQMNGCVAPPDAVSRIRDETEGWPASLSVVLTISRGGVAGYGEAARAYVMGFFETEIWDGLEEETKLFLLKTSVLDELTPSACRAVTDMGATRPILRRLFANGLFIARLDERDSYCYHRVFRDFLRDRLGERGLDERELYRKLAWWLFDQHRFEQSFPCFFKGGDMYGMSQVLKVIDLADMDMESFLELTQCIGTLKIEEFRQYPIVVARMALIEFLKGNVTGMQALYRTYIEWNDEDANTLSPSEYAEYLWESGWLCYLDPDEPTMGNEKHLSFANYRYYVPHLKESHMARTALISFPTYFRGIRDYGDDGIFETESILMRVEQGEKYILDEEESIWKTYLILAEYKYETEEFSRAEEIVRRVMTMAQDRQYTDLYFCGTALLVKLMRAAHNTREIDAVTARLGAMIVKNAHNFLLPNFHALELRNRLAAGGTGFTEDFERDNRDCEDKPYFYLIYRHFALVRGLLSLGNCNHAMLILGNMELLCEKYKRPTDLIEVRVLKAVALRGLGYETEAAEQLENALRAAEPFGYIRIFSDDAKDIWPILELARRRMKGKYIQNVVISCKKALSRAGHVTPGKNIAQTALTKSELEILKALQSGMSYTEIALDKGVRVSTVKSHLHSVYSKLEVNNRTAAIIAAQTAGILDNP